MTASLGSSSSDPVSASFQAQLEPHLLIPVPPSRGPMEVRGQFDTARKTGTLHVGALGLPVELASPWLAEDSKDNALLQGWSLDVDTDLELGGESSGLTGIGQLSLARQDDTWATGEIELLSATAPAGVAARIDGLVLPNRPGKRSIRAVVEVPEWTQIQQLTLREGEIEILDTDLADLREDVASIWPGPLPEAVDRSLAGLLEAKLMAAGAIEDLQADVEGSWSHTDGDRVELRATATAERVTLESISGQIGARRFSGSAQVDLPTPIERAEARFELMDLLPEVPKIDLSVVLAGGVAKIEAQPETSNGVTPALTAEVPLASLGDLPKVGEALDALPLVRTAGPLRLAWQVPEAEWAEWISQFQEEFPLSSLRLGSRGSLQLDLSQPLAGSGRMILDPLEVSSQELTVVAEGPIQARLERGELILEAARLATGGGLLEVEAWTKLVTNWEPGSSLGSLFERFRIEANGAAPLALLQDFVDDLYTDGDLQVALSVSGTPEELTGEARIHGLGAELRIGDPAGVRLSNPTLEGGFRRRSDPGGPGRARDRGG